MKRIGRIIVQPIQIYKVIYQFSRPHIGKLGGVIDEKCSAESRRNVKNIWWEN